jgi:hypothetical protein
MLTDYIQFYLLNADLVSAPGQPNLRRDAIAICSNCFHSRVFLYPQIAAAFTAMDMPPKVPSGEVTVVSYGELICSLSLARVRQTFYQQCIPQKSVLPLITYARFNTTLPACDGTPVSSDVAYYTSELIAGMAICTTCFEQRIRLTSFERYMKQTNNDEGEDWYCDLGMKGFIRRIVVAESEKDKPNFDLVVAKVKPRLESPGCPGVGVAIAPAGFGMALAFDTTNGKSGCFCPECYYEHVAETALESVFCHQIELDESQKGVLGCDLSTEYAKFAMKAAIVYADDEVWRKPVSLRDSLPPCKGLVGVDEEELQDLEEDSPPWYHHRVHPSIEVCPGCYCLTVELMGAAKLFSPIARPLENGVVRLCYFSASKDMSADVSDPFNFENTLVWRGKMLRTSLVHGFLSRGNFAVFQQVAKAISARKPPCGGGSRGFKVASKRKWFGRYTADVNDSDDATLVFCEECYSTYIKDTPLEAHLSQAMNGAVDHFIEGFFCNSNSNRQRQYLREACDRGDWAHYVRYWRKRQEVRARWEPAIVRMRAQVQKLNGEIERANALAKQQNAMLSLQIMSNINAQTNGIMAGIGGSFAEAAASSYGPTYGNSTVSFLW